MSPLSAFLLSTLCNFQLHPCSFLFFSYIGLSSPPSPYFIPYSWRTLRSSSITQMHFSTAVFQQGPFCCCYSMAVIFLSTSLSFPFSYFCISIWVSPPWPVCYISVKSSVVIQLQSTLATATKVVSFQNINPTTMSPY